jgi:SAM-dependent methyltransferase
MSNEATRKFYDQQGWHREAGGRFVDTALFGTKEDGPIRIELDELRARRILNALQKAGPRLNMIELGCGGTPALFLAPVAEHVTLCDFSRTGLAEAAGALKGAGIPHTCVEADICNIPLPDGAFDAAYCAHALYHIADPQAQETALREIMRLLRPGGVAVLVVANPYPLLFSVRLMRRLAARAPVIGDLLRQLRPTPPLPYNPLSLRRMRGILERHADVDISIHTVASTWAHQNISEHVGPGRLLWSLFRAIEQEWPQAAALGAYATIVAQRR